MYDNLIERTLLKAAQVRGDAIGFVAASTTDGMVVKIWYRTIGDENVLVKFEAITVEEWEWEKAGCTNNEEWHAYLNKQMWKDYSAGLNTN